ncbi:MAG: ribose-phosphate diphosphokinase [Thermoplasmata archaeon]|nr:ribose-phosphate diphosphokinase [Thermoplasmata archaeon]MBE3137855.1 ribose-phosphate diphosphokinase [Thermoplasmata archaeon]MBE3141336.1 ribose-phosphate diphosphokinase [Thermoplasmata archaeon]
MYILGGTSAKNVAQNLANKIQQPLLQATYKRFPDDEFYVRVLDDIAGEDVLIVQTAYPDPKIVELLLMQDAVHDAGAKKITVVLPYFGYSRQDKKFEEGEAISSRAVAQHISMHADCVITVDPHKEHILKFFSVPAYSCSAVSTIAQYLKEKNIDFILAPDKGAKDRAKEAATLINCEYDYLEKTRIDGTTVKITPKKLDARGKHVAIIDDIISTGGTMANSIKELKKQGAKTVSVACTHGLFVGGAKEKLLSADCDEIISTDTIETEFSKVSAADCIAELLLKTLPHIKN